MMKFVPSSVIVTKDDRLEISKVRLEGREDESDVTMDQLLDRASML